MLTVFVEHGVKRPTLFIYQLARPLSYFKMLQSFSGYGDDRPFITSTSLARHFLRAIAVKAWSPDTLPSRFNSSIEINSEANLYPRRQTKSCHSTHKRIFWYCLETSQLSMNCWMLVGLFRITVIMRFRGSRLFLMRKYCFRIPISLIRLCNASHQKPDCWSSCSLTGMHSSSYIKTRPSVNILLTFLHNPIVIVQTLAWERIHFHQPERLRPLARSWRCWRRLTS